MTSDRPLPVGVGTGIARSMACAAICSTCRHVGTQRVLCQQSTLIGCDGCIGRVAGGTKGRNQVVIGFKGQGGCCKVAYAGLAGRVAGLAIVCSNWNMNGQIFSYHRTRCQTGVGLSGRMAGSTYRPGYGR